MSYLTERLLPIGRWPVIRRTSEMDAKTQRQDARRRAREARTEQDKARKAREKRLEDLAVNVLVAVDAVAEQERRAGEALRMMVEDEGLSLREAVGWCGDEVSVRTAARLKRLVSDRSDDDADEEAGDRAGDQADDEPARTTDRDRAGSGSATAGAARVSA